MPEFEHKYDAVKCKLAMCLPTMTSITDVAIIVSQTEPRFIASKLTSSEISVKRNGGGMQLGEIQLEPSEGTTDRRVRSHPSQCTTSRADRQIVHMAVSDRSVTSRTVVQHIQPVTHHPVSSRTIRRRLQQSGLYARRPLLRLPLTQNHRRLRHQWCDERRMWTAAWNEIVFTDESRFYLQHHDGWIRVWRHRGERLLNSCVMHRHTVLHQVLWYGAGSDITLALL
ncbi:Transposase [Cordylochernes scorpioides]|uniref:Transposase n=1 Tax=Cordylochernes scorpioides TaxID=51811 RepID=A0ABY6M057_9ARAC|nr:Transposase [Cordylochernes scorpioides]